MTRIQFFRAAILLLMGCNPLVASVSVKLPVYLPLHVGDSWTLRDEYGNIYKHEVIGTEVINGQVTYQYTNWEGNPGYYNLFYEGTTLKMAGINGVPLNPPRVYSGADIDSAFVHIVYDMEPIVATPAGVFHDVIREKIYSKEGGRDILTRVQYFAKGMGLVKDEEWSADSGGTYQYTALLVSYQMENHWLSMFGLDSICGSRLDLYLYGMDAGDLRVVKRNCNAAFFGSVNKRRSKMVYGETSVLQGVTWIKIYDMATDSNTIIATLDGAEPATCFDCNDMVAYCGDDGEIKRMDASGQGTATLAKPQAPYRLSMFWISPDRKRIVAIENQRGSDYETGNYQRLVLFNADGSGHKVLLERYLGDWNCLTWRPDSSEFLYYYHTFNGQPRPYHTETAQYATFDLSKDPIARTDLSNSSLGRKDENVCLFTRSGNLLGILTGELYDATTGSLLADRSADVPDLSASIIGSDEEGRIYFAAPNGEGFREFDESLCSNKNTQYSADDYFPLRIGNFWQYHCTVTETGDSPYVEYTYQYVADVEKFNSTFSYRVKNDIDNIAEENEDLYYSVTPDGIYLAGAYDADADDTGYSLALKFAPPVLFLKACFSKGDTWSTTSEQIVERDGVVETVASIRRVSTASESTPLTTPAGIFPDCVRIVVYTYATEGLVEEAQLWFVAGIGLVKEEYTGPDYSWSNELQYYSVDGVTGGAERK